MIYEPKKDVLDNRRLPNPRIGGRIDNRRLDNPRIVEGEIYIPQRKEATKMAKQELELTCNDPVSVKRIFDALLKEGELEVIADGKSYFNPTWENINGLLTNKNGNEHREITLKYRG